MKKTSINNAKLGVFVLAGLLFLVLLLYMIGKNRSMFGKTYTLKARFENVHGLVAGNNVRFSGIQAGTVKKIRIINDTVIEVSMFIDKKMLGIIRKDAVVSIGTDGLVGNKVINISPSRRPGEAARENDILVSKKTVDTDEMMETLYNTNNDVAVIASELRRTVQQVNSSALWELLHDDALPNQIKASVASIRSAAARSNSITENLQSMVADIKNGKGSLGAILTDTSFSANLGEAILNIKAVAMEADSLAGEITKMTQRINHDINEGNGTVHALLKDSVMLIKLNNSLDNIQKGTDGFNQNMEALKHNFLLRGYFRKQEKLKRKEEDRQASAQ